jgi:hypothetical protein
VDLSRYGSVEGLQAFSRFCVVLILLAAFFILGELITPSHVLEPALF